MPPWEPRAFQSAHGSSGGVDFGAPIGTTVVASDGGTVTKASSGYNGGYGTVVEIDHHDGTSSLYAHLSTLLVPPGQSVTPGQALGYIGMTGKTTGPHLHFEIRRYNAQLDPKKLIMGL